MTHTSHITQFCEEWEKALGLTDGKTVSYLFNTSHLSRVILAKGVAKMCNNVRQERVLAESLATYLSNVQLDSMEGQIIPLTTP